MLQYNYKKISRIIILLLIVALVIFLISGVFDYYKYRKAAAEAAGAGYPWQCGAMKVTYIQMGCTQSCEGKCCCLLCDANCEGTTEMDFIGQENCGAAVNVCVSPEVLVKGGAKTVEECNGKQAIFAGVSNLMMNGNAVVACPGSVAASNIDRLVNWLDKYIIAGFRDKIK
jgi:hypothetical protein